MAEMEGHTCKLASDIEHQKQFLEKKWVGIER